MKEIKFRAWDGERMQPAFDLTQNPVFWWQDNFDYPLMQYTGLQDKNGRDIYEGDIVRVNDDWDDPSTHEVNWGGEYPAFELYPGFDLESNNLMSALAGEGGMTVEVIGNIYENPELLESAS